MLTTSLSIESFSQAQAAAPTEDVAQIPYKANKSLLLQQIQINNAYKAVIKAHDNYVTNPNASSTYQKLKDAVTADLTVLQSYSDLVDKAKRIQAQIDQAKETFYGETPATKEEIEKGPVGTGTPPEGESIASEIPIPPPMLVKKLKKEINDNGGPQSLFAEQLRAQAEKLQAVKQRVENEAKSEEASSNPTAQKEDANLITSLQKAIEARRKALGYK